MFVCVLAILPDKYEQIAYILIRYVHLGDLGAVTDSDTRTTRVDKSKLL